MNKYSFFVLVITLIFLAGCYSFTGGSIPAHFKTLQIVSVIDESGFGNPENRINLEAGLLRDFRRDNSFELIESFADARLGVVIVSIQESTQTVSTGELETERRLTVNCSVEYYDEVNKKQIWKKTFSNYALFSVNNAFVARNEAAVTILNQISEDILLAVVSGW